MNLVVLLFFSNLKFHSDKYNETNGFNTVYAKKHAVRVVKRAFEFKKEQEIKIVSVILEDNIKALQFIF